MRYLDYWVHWIRLTSLLASGKYVIRLEEKYSVKITFPRETAEENGSEDAKGGRPREALKSDEVLIKGGKKGVAGAKAEILEVLNFLQVMGLH